MNFLYKELLKAKSFGWATDAIVYDEQPTGFKQSWSQRSRWTVGHMQCINEYTLKLAKAIKDNKSMVNVDGFLYIIGSIPMFVLTLILLFTNFLLYSADGMTEGELVINLLRYLVPTFVFPSLTAAFVMYLDKKPIKPMIKFFFTYPLFMGSWLLINFKCLFKRDTSWEKIEHKRSISINEINAESQEETVNIK